MLNDLTAIGLAFDIIGFAILTRHLWKDGPNRPFWSNGTWLDRLAIVLVLVGFALPIAPRILDLPAP